MPLAWKAVYPHANLWIIGPQENFSGSPIDCISIYNGIRASEKCKSSLIRFFSFYELCGSLLYNLNISYPQLRNNLGPLISFKKENRLNKNRNLVFHLDMLTWLYETIRPAKAVCRFL